VLYTLVNVLVIDAVLVPTGATCTPPPVPVQTSTRVDVQNAEFLPVSPQAAPQTTDKGRSVPQDTPNNAHALATHGRHIEGISNRS
jgi:hypothetical protein